MLVLQGLGVRILDIVLFSNLVQTIDARITPFQTFNQMHPRTHVLIPRPMKFSARLAQQFLNVHTPSLLLVRGMSWLLISSSVPTHHFVSNRFRLNHDAIFYLVPNLPNRVGLSNIWRHEVLDCFLYPPNSPLKLPRSNSSSSSGLFWDGLLSLAEGVKGMDLVGVGVFLRA